MMSGIVAHHQDCEADYTAIESAVMETERGRWFLHAFARRNRHADTEVLLTALSRIERTVSTHQEPDGFNKIRLDILEMSKAIARTRTEIAAIRPDEAGGGRLLEASGELDSIVSTTERATSDILAAAESIQETAWTMREANADPTTCDKLDERATEIYTACSFQDLTSQRIRKVIDALGFLEKRVNAMVDIWQFSDDGADQEPSEKTSPSSNAMVMSQADVDDVLIESHQLRFAPERNAAMPTRLPEASWPVAEPVSPEFAVIEPAIADVMAQTAMASMLLLEDEASESPALLHDGEAARAHDIDEMLFTPPAALLISERALPGAEHLQLVSSQPDVDSAIDKVRTGIGLSADEASKALDALKSMSVEDRTRLFS